MIGSMFTESQEAAIRAAIAYECDRQHVGLDRREFLYDAYREAYLLATAGELPTMATVTRLAGMLEPSNGGRLRVTPVTFSNGGGSTDAALIPRALGQLVEAVDQFTDSEEDVHYWVKEFLWIHPFSDGNGRTGFLLYNWLRRTMLKPAQMPYFFGE